ncbi:MAG: V-type ATP synthase subunit E [Candidatus Brocadiaceae bacterium]|nr:V-type ATP synthase subunit E [Candidatus Brocadiaceae bacterium]
MTLERIKAHILEQAKTEAERLIEGTREGLELRLSRARVSLRKEMEGRLAALDHKLQEENAFALSRLRAQNHLKLLELKNQLVEGIFHRVLEHLLSLPAQEYLELLEGWLNRLELRERAYLRLSPEDTNRIGEELVNKINSSRKAGAPPGISSEVLFLDTDTAPIKGGFILRTRKFEIDHSVETFLKQLKEDLTPKLAEELFGGNQ